MIKKISQLILSLLFVLLTNNFVSAQTPSQEDLAVQLSATVQLSPPKITLSWKPITWGPPVYTKIYRKPKTAASWGKYLDSIPYSSSKTNYVDANVVADSAYEYKVIIGGFVTSCISGFTLQTISSGYIYAGIKTPAIHNRGTLILLVANNLLDSCSAEITTLMNDIRGDGWQIIRHDYPTTTSDVTIKAAIVKDYKNNKNVKAVLILGHLAVPYSGKVMPDYHSEHEGAWPADVFYGDMDGLWTDNSISCTTGNYAANHNIPGDGKWDQSQIPSNVELQVSRIDLSDMPAFPATEIQLIKNYLKKDHLYKLNTLGIRHRGVFNDDFSNTLCGESFSANTYRNWAPLISRDSITVSGYKYLIPYMQGTYPGSGGGYQWAFGAGGGTFTSCAGIGITSDFVGKANNTIFSMYFGSYFGDWNVQNNYLRAPLCQNPPTLTNCWVTRPNWFFHHMALGENIGYSTIITQNNKKFSIDPYLDTAYSTFINQANSQISIALMGDLTLRTDYIIPIGNLVATADNKVDAVLTWTASSENGILGYYVYRSDSIYGFYERLNTNPITGVTYLDSIPPDGLIYYMVRPVKLQNTPSGSYYNLGIGIVDTVYLKKSTTGLDNIKSTIDVNFFPNPNNTTLFINAENINQLQYQIINSIGQLIHQGNLTGNSIDVSNLHNGIYMIRLTDKKNETSIYKFIKQ